MYAGLNNGHIGAYDVATKTNLGDFAHASAIVESLAINSGGTMLFTGLNNGHIGVYDVATKTNLGDFAYTGAIITSLAMSPAAVVPEPAGWAMMLVGVVLTGAFARRRKRL